MATSNSHNYTINRNEAIKEALSLVGVGVEGESVEPEDTSIASRKLNLMIKAWQAYGIKLWQRDEHDITLVASQNTYTLGQKSEGTATTDSANKLVDNSANFLIDNIAVGDTAYNVTDGTSAAVTAIDDYKTLSFASDLFPDGNEVYMITSADVSVPRPLRILDCERVDTNGNNTSLTLLTKQEWDDLSNKTTTGTPVNYHYDPTLNNGTLYIWQMPDATIASTYTLKITVNSPLEDMDSSTDDFDFPQEWLEAITYGLAYRLAPTYGLPQTERTMLKMDMDEALNLARDYDSEDGSIFFQPEVR